MNKEEILDNLILDCLTIIVKNSNGLGSGESAKTAFNWNYSQIKDKVEKALKELERR